MQVEIVRQKQTRDSTLGRLSFQSFSCYTLEDGYTEKKEYGLTRIPAGEYSLSLRREGRFYEKYCDRFNEDHSMIHLLDVPDYEYILIHPGFSVDDTRGCILTGSRYELRNRLFYVYDSTKAYLALRKLLIPVMEKELVKLMITEKWTDSIL